MMNVVLTPHSASISDVANVEQQFLEAGHDLIFATAFGYQPFTQQVDGVTSVRNAPSPAATSSPTGRAAAVRRRPS